MQLHLPTLLLTSQLVCCACGMMFLVGPRTSKSPFYGWFGGAFLCAPCASIFYLLAELDADWPWAYPVGNAVATLAIALAWVGARSVNGRSLSLPCKIAFSVPALVLASVLGKLLATGSTHGAWTGALPFFLSFSAFAGLAAREFWRSDLDQPPLLHARVLAVACGVNSAWYLARTLGLLVLGTDHPVTLAVLGPASSDILMTLMIVVASLGLSAIAKERALRTAHRLATLDSLTGLLNRREFARRIEEMSGGTAVRDCAVLLVDLDHFKSINDNWGHLVGDEVLRAFARVLRGSLRGQDLACRFGGEEFAALLPGLATTAAVEAARRIHQRLASSNEAVFGRVRPTASIGVACAGAVAMPLHTLLRQADAALYRAKDTGRNRTEVFSEGQGFTASTGLHLAIGAQEQGAFH